MDFSLAKKERLKSKKHIEKLFAEGTHVSNFPLKLVYLNTHFADRASLKAMVIAPKKNFKSAVSRNRIKRVLREAYRLNKHVVFNNIEGHYALAILYLGKEMPDYEMANHKMQGLLKRFNEEVSNEKTS
ncbi:ribonuclease P protein component [Croceitalea sp. MTPC5]|uniref:ribonuclease P protein component n=1 Tax=Croceitalea sp. MTPC5 TaxID=3056565 RepID=UPI002B3C7548|nr:ribonuclease P protein component [Croceitalea sp. MTPC5]